MIRFVLKNRAGRYYSGTYDGKFSIPVEGSTDEVAAAVVFSAEFLGGSLSVEPLLPRGWNDRWTAHTVSITVADVEPEEKQAQDQR